MHVLDLEQFKVSGSLIFAGTPFLNDFEIESSISEIGAFKEESWKSLVKSKITAFVPKYLNFIVGSKSQKYHKLKLSKYLSSQNENIPVETAKFIAKTQSHMIEIVKTNFQSYYKSNLFCKACLISESNQPNLLYCKKLIRNDELVTYIPN